MKEIWKDIPGYEGYYQVSNYGKIMGVNRTLVYKKRGKEHSHFVKRKVLSQIINHKGYFRICLRKNGNSKQGNVSRLVAIAFVPNPENKPQVNHIDGNKLNDRVDNLEWVTARENIIHGYKNGLFPKKRKSKKHFKKEDVFRIRDLIKTQTLSSVAKEYNACVSTIHAIKHKINWKNLK
jgi:hypothetical protein